MRSRAPVIRRRSRFAHAVILLRVTTPDLTGLMVLLAVASALVIVIGVAALLHALLRPPRKTYAVALGRGLPTDPGEMGERGQGAEGPLSYEAVAFSLHDGSATPGWIITGDNPRGPTVVVTHGFGDSRYGALTWAPLLVPHASSVVLYDLRGHGEAESRYAHCGTTDVADLLGVLDQLPSAGPVVLLGYSMGGGIALAAAARNDAREEGARIVGVIADGPYRFWDEPIRCYLRARRYPVWPFVPLTGWVLRLLWPGFTPRTFDRAGHARRLRCPLLVLHGEVDPLCPTASARAIADAAPAPGGEWIEFAAGGHLDLPAVDEAKYRAALARFFHRVG